MRKKALETVLGTCLVILGISIQMKNVEAFGAYTANQTESESAADDWYNETMKRILGDIRDPYGFYYTTPGCEETDLYYGSGLGDTLYICIYPGESNSIFVSMQSLLGDDLYASNEHPVELYFDSDQEKWVDDNGAFLVFDENNNRFIYSDSSIQICLENFTVSSAWEGPTHLWGDIHPEGEYIADDGTTITYTASTNAATTTTKDDWRKGMQATLEGTWDVSTANVLKNKGLTLKSNKWLATADTDMGATANEHAIYAMIKVEDDGTMTVTYNPASIKEGIN